MRKLLFIFLIIISVNGILLCYAKEGKENSELLDVVCDDISYIKYFATSGGTGTPSMYHYTKDTNQIEYIFHCLNSLTLVERSQSINGGDLYTVIVDIGYSSGNFRRLYFVERSFLKDYVQNKIYALDKTEFYRFEFLLKGLASEKIVPCIYAKQDISEWAKKEVDTAVDKNLVPIWNRINYSSYITRAEVCQLSDNLLIKLKNESSPNVKSPFNDISDPAVTRLYNLGIINGKSYNEFSPYDIVTREELAKILCGVYNVIQNDSEQTKNTDVLFSDNKEISDWAKPYVAKMNSLKILVGDENGNFNPKECCTKEQVIVAILRLYNALSEEIATEQVS